MTGFPIRASDCVGSFNAMRMERPVELHTWVIYRQLAGGSGRFSVAFPKVRNKGYKQADYHPPKRLGMIQAMNSVILATALSEDVVKIGCALDLGDGLLPEAATGPAGWTPTGRATERAGPHTQIHVCPCHGPQTADLHPCAVGNDGSSGGEGLWDLRVSHQKTTGMEFSENTAMCRNYHMFFTMICEVEIVEFFNLDFTA